MSLVFPWCGDTDTDYGFLSRIVILAWAVPHRPPSVRHPAGLVFCVAVEWAAPQQPELACSLGGCWRTSDFNVVLLPEVWAAGKDRVGLESH